MKDTRTSRVCARGPLNEEIPSGLDNGMVYRPLRYEQMMRAAEAYDVRARRMFGGMGILFIFILAQGIWLNQFVIHDKK